MQDNFLFQYMLEPTRQRGSDTPSTLDLIFITEENMIPEVDINYPLWNGDQATILFKLKCYMDREEPTVKSFYNKGDYVKMRKLLNNIDWEEEL